MATNVGDFFIGSNSVYNITDEDYQKSTFDKLRQGIREKHPPMCVHHRLFQAEFPVCFREFGILVRTDIRQNQGFRV